LGLIGLAAIVGHIFPIFFKLKGGKGVATALGVIFSLSLILGAITLALFLIILAITRYVSLGSICAIAATPLITLFIGHTGYFLPLMIAAILVIWRHKENIYRLHDGVENKVSFR
jgi:glycerol-3-phosphate acyltransferase PlsY